MELERGELIGDGHRGVDLLDGAVDLQAVVVNNEHKVVELVVAGEHRGLPHLTLFDLAVAQQDVRAISVAPVLGGKCHANASRDALTEGTGGHVNTRRVIHVGMTLQMAADVAQ